MYLRALGRRAEEVLEQMLMGAGREKRFCWNAHRAVGASFWRAATVSASGNSRDSSAAMTAPSSFVRSWVSAPYCRRRGNEPNGASLPIKSFTHSHKLIRTITFATSGIVRLRE
jgi:hypothetical protein